MEKLKPCPFCGAEAHIWRTNYATYIECHSYDPVFHQVQIRGHSEEDSIMKWNRRSESEGNPVHAEHIVFGTNYVCPKCGEYIFPAAKYCNGCGIRLNWEED